MFVYPSIYKDLGRASLLIVRISSNSTWKKDFVSKTLLFPLMVEFVKAARLLGV